jgi:hypothetical protein
MNINRNDLKSLQSAYRTVLTESQETGYNSGMNNKSALKDLSIVDNLIAELQHLKSSGVERLAFTTPDESTDFEMVVKDDGEETDLVFVHLKPLN